MTGDITIAIEDIVFDYLRDNLTLESKTSETYCGHCEEHGLMYKSSHKIELTLSGKVISEIYLD